jgi:hypothetical protein
MRRTLYCVEERSSALSTPNAPRVSMSAVRSKSRNAVSSGLPTLRTLLDWVTPKIISVITTTVKTYVEGLELAANLADEQVPQRRSWNGRILGPDGRQLGPGALNLPVFIIYRAIALVAEGKSAGTGVSAGADFATTVVEDDVHSSLPLLLATSSTIFVNNWSFTVVLLV